MTNPKHTSSDLAEWCSQDLPCARYQALEAEVERLREALEKIVDPVELEGFTDYQRMQAAATHILWHRDIARAALETKHD